jgi:hypothetical protein
VPLSVNPVYWGSRMTLFCLWRIVESMTHLRLFVGLLLLFVSTQLHTQGISIIEIGNVQLARSLAAKVHDSAGSPIAGVLVEELSTDWKTLLRSTKTDV